MLSFDDIDFIIVDDSKIDIMILDRLIRKAFHTDKVLKIDSPVAAYDFLLRHFPNRPVTLFLDLNMPVYNGFDILEMISGLPINVHKYYTIYVVTSSKNAIDITRCNSYQIVKQVIIKPINLDILLGLPRE